MAIFSSVAKALSRTKDTFSNAFARLGSKRPSAETIEELEEELLSADLGFDTVESIINVISRSKSDVRSEVYDHLVSLLPDHQSEDEFEFPHVLFIVGVNGTGKTTSAAKLAHYFKKKGKSVMLIAADTYRAAAVEQLKIWSERVGVKLVHNEMSKEPSSVLFDGLNSAKASKPDVIIVDTAGRLHTYKNLMAELEKMMRVQKTRFPEFNSSSLITIDASLGQNSLIQAREFAASVDLDGAILTKLDGTAKGGIIFSLYRELKLPVWYIGTGEKMEDLYPFSPGEFVKFLLGNENEK